MANFLDSPAFTHGVAPGIARLTESLARIAANARANEKRLAVEEIRLGAKQRATAAKTAATKLAEEERKKKSERTADIRLAGKLSKAQEAVTARPDEIKVSPIDKAVDPDDLGFRVPANVAGTMQNLGAGGAVNPMTGVVDVPDDLDPTTGGVRPETQRLLETAQVAQRLETLFAQAKNPQIVAQFAPIRAAIASGSLDAQAANEMLKSMEAAIFADTAELELGQVAGMEEAPFSQQIIGQLQPGQSLHEALAGAITGTQQRAFEALPPQQQVEVLGQQYGLDRKVSASEGATFRDLQDPAHQDTFVKVISGGGTQYDAVARTRGQREADAMLGLKFMKPLDMPDLAGPVGLFTSGETIKGKKAQFDGIDDVGSWRNARSSFAGSFNGDIRKGAVAATLYKTLAKRTGTDVTPHTLAKLLRSRSDNEIQSIMINDMKLNPDQRRHVIEVSHFFGFIEEGYGDDKAPVKELFEPTQPAGILPQPAAPAAPPMGPNTMMGPESAGFFR